MDRPLLPDRLLVDRFARDLDELIPPEARLGIAVSGGPDSVALLLLAAAAGRGTIAAATVDHRLRPESGLEAQFVAQLCAEIDVPHVTLAVEVPRGSSMQAHARHARYRALGDWAIEHSLAAVATAHHADDQAETLLMRLARGAGLSGLAATRRARLLDKDILLVRPLLGWRRAELRTIVESAGIEPVDDPANRDPRHDRSRFRGLVEQSDWAEAERLASSAQWLADAEEAIEWSVAALLPERLAAEEDGLRIDPGSLPREIQRRLLLAAFDRIGEPRPRGPQVERAMRTLAAGGSATLGRLKLTGGESWRLRRAPPRRVR